MSWNHHITYKHKIKCERANGLNSSYRLRCTFPNEGACRGNTLSQQCKMIKILNKTRIVRIVSFQTSLRLTLDPRNYTPRPRPSFQMSDVESRMSDVGCQISDVGCLISDVGCRMSNLGCQMSDVKSGMSDVECRISDANLGCRISDVRCRMLDVGWHLQASVGKKSVLFNWKISN